MLAMKGDAVMLANHEINIVVAEAVKRYEALNGVIGIAADDIRDLIADFGGDEHDFYAAMRLSYEVVINGKAIPDIFIS